ncbi:MULTISPECIES: hypothetical protein [Sinorhizobium]|nr:MULTISPECIES: hypothetical protein [Sinorhizobium]
MIKLAGGGDQAELPGIEGVFLRLSRNEGKLVGKQGAHVASMLAMRAD